MRIAVFGGSFDPVHKEHIEYAKNAVKELALDKLLIMPSFLAPHKRGGANASGEDRLALLEKAFYGEERIEVCPYEIERGETSYTYLTAEWLKNTYPKAERFWLVGKDMLEDFYTWKNPKKILSCVKLVACGRGEEISLEQHKRFRKSFGCDFLQISFVGEEVSSTQIRVEIAFGKRPSALPQEVLSEIEERGLYRFEAIAPALALEKPSRVEHSFRVAQMACERAKSLKIPEKQALLASALHDCGKYVSLSSPLLRDFVPPTDVPLPVLHQYTGAYLAEYEFGVSDEEILSAIRYHTSGREGASALERLIFLADLLEEERDFPDVERLRTLFWQDLDECYYQSLSSQTEYLRQSGKPVYELTERAYEWEKRLRSK